MQRWIIKWLKLNWIKLQQVLICSWYTNHKVDLGWIGFYNASDSNLVDHCARLQIYLLTCLLIRRSRKRTINLTCTVLGRGCAVPSVETAVTVKPRRVVGTVDTFSRHAVATVAVFVAETLSTCANILQIWLAIVERFTSMITIYWKMLLLTEIETTKNLRQRERTQRTTGEWTHVCGSLFLNVNRLTKSLSRWPRNFFQFLLNGLDACRRLLNMQRKYFHSFIHSFTHTHKTSCTR